MARLSFLLAALVPVTLWAHSGGLDKSGCHRDRKAGGYHCHRGAFAGRSWSSRAEGRAAMAEQRSAPEKASAQEKAGPLETPASAPPEDRTIESFHGKVVRVLDGDTIEVLKGKKRVRVRLWAVDAPEKGEPFAKAAKKATAKYVLKKEVRVDVYDEDRYGRSVGEVFIGKSSLNRMLVVDGMARWVRRHAPDDKGFKDNEDYARRVKLGLWSASPKKPARTRGKSRKGGQ